MALVSHLAQERSARNEAVALDLHALLSEVWCYKVEATVPSAAAHSFGIMSGESESIFALTTNRLNYFSLKLRVSPAIKRRVDEKQFAEDPYVEGIATSVQLRGTTETPVGVTIRTHMRYVSLEKVTNEFVRSLHLNDRLDGVYQVEANQGWRDCDYLSYPVPDAGVTLPEMNERGPKHKPVSSKSVKKIIE